MRIISHANYRECPLAFIRFIIRDYSHDNSITKKTALKEPPFQNTIAQ